MELEEYHRELIAKVRDTAADGGLFDHEAFFQVACEMLRDSEAIADYQHVGYRFGEGTSRFMAIDGYDQSAFEMDESIVVIAFDDYFNSVGDEQVASIQSKGCMRYIGAMHRYIVAAWDGSFLEQAEESSLAWEFASFIHEHRDAISRFRLYFLTDREYTGRDSSIKDPTDFYSRNEHKVSLEAHVWDLRHLMEASQAAAPLEHLTVDLGEEGLPAVKSPASDNGMDTYLMFLSGETLADWYKKHGSKLMEANVRSFLSLRGKVNRGIGNTLVEEPDRFVAYNNGLSATASSVDVNERGNITAIHDLQIVNGGQTTASIFYTKKKEKDKIDLSRVVVPVKLVVVREDVARELVPYISRYTNSQNKVDETDFSSNSEYQIRLSTLSQQVLTPPLPGRNPTHWYYERTRGQYDGERNRRDTAERKQFERLNPSKQRIKMIDAPKYLMCWDGYPHVASLGSQKCFARFVETETKKGPEGVNALDAEFFKQLVCKRIIFDTVYKHIKTADWYRGAYQTNIAEYAVAKYALDLNRFYTHPGFEAIWRTQRISDQVLGCLLKAAEQASRILNDPDRPTQNVSEWAKKEACWDALRRQPSCLDAKPAPTIMTGQPPAALVKPTAPAQARPAASARQDTAPTDRPPIARNDIHMPDRTPDTPQPAPRSAPKHKAPEDTDRPHAELIDDWAEAPAGFLQDLYRFARQHNILSPKSKASLETLIDGRTDGINANALNHLLTTADKCGFQYDEQPAPAEPEQPEETGKPSDPVSPSTPEHARRPQPDIDQDIDYQRDFLTAITPDTWRTILEWARYRNIMTDEALAGVAKIEKHIRLTDEQTRHLWAWRQRMISRGFPASQFAPRPGTY